MSSSMFAAYLDLRFWALVFHLLQDYMEDLLHNF